jgi:Flp pilus assembly protein TadD
MGRLERRGLVAAAIIRVVFAGFIQERYVNSAFELGSLRSVGSTRVSRLAFAALLILALGSCTSKTAAQLATDALNAGLKAHLAGNTGEATLQYKECLKHEPANKYCLFNLGVIAQSEGSVVDAENYYRLSIAQDAKFSRPLFNLAILQTAAGATEEAVALYRRVIELEPGNAGAHLNLGLLLIATGDDAGGRAEIALAVLLDPTIHAPAPAPEASATPSDGPSASPDKSPSPSQPKK